MANADCQGSPSYTWSLTSFPGLFVGATNGVGNLAGQFYIPGVYDITYTATDVCGNSTPHSFTFTIVDNVDPMVMCPPDITLSNVLDNCFQNALWDEATVSDNCPGTIDLAVVGVDPNGGPVNILTFQSGACSDQMGFDGDYAPANWSAPVPGVDWSGAPGSLTIANSGPPSPKDVTTSASEAGLIVFNWAYTPGGVASGDDFGYLLNGTYYPLVGPLPSFATSGTSVFAVAPGDMLGFRLIDGALSSATVTISGFEFICGSAGNVSFASFPVGVSTMTYTATDLAMNTATCTFTVTVEDTQAPEITCGGAQILPTICDNAQIPDYTGNVAVLDENCPDVTISQTPPVGTTLGSIFAPAMPMDGGTFDVTLEVTDQGGNTDDCVFTVTLADNDAPVPTVDPLPAINPATTLGTDCGTFMLCAPTALDCNGNLIYGTTALAGATFMPNGCGAGMPGYLINASNNFAVQWTYDDGNGNLATQVQQVDIEDDTTAPTLNCPPDVTVNTDPGVCTATGLLGLTMTEILPRL